MINILNAINFNYDIIGKDIEKREFVREVNEAFKTIYPNEDLTKINKLTLEFIQDLELKILVGTLCFEFKDYKKYKMNKLNGKEELLNYLIFDTEEYYIDVYLKSIENLENPLITIAYKPMKIKDYSKEKEYPIYFIKVSFSINENNMDDKIISLILEDMKKNGFIIKNKT